MDSSSQARTKQAKAKLGSGLICSSLRILCVLGVSAVSLFQRFFAAKMQRSPRLCREKLKLGHALKISQHLTAGLLLLGVGLQALAQQPIRTTPSNPSPTEVRQLLAAGQAAQDAGRFDEAIYSYNRVLSLTSASPRDAALANLKIGTLYMVQRKFENAASAFQRAATLNPADAEAFNNLGEALGELKQYTRAIEAFTTAARLDQKLLKARYNQGVSYDRMGNFRYAEFVFKNLIKSNPDYALAYGALAVTLSKSGRAKEAIAYHEKAIALDPRDPSNYFNLALSYLILGNSAKALEQREKLKAIDPAAADRLASVIVKHQM